MATRDRLATRLLGSSFPALAALFAALFMAYGTESPFLPAFLGERGASPGQIGLMLAAGTVMRLAVTPFIGATADRLRAVRGTLALFGLLAGALSFTYLLGSGFAVLLGLSLLNAFATAPLAPLADAIALPAARREGSFDYGWVRGVGSGAFVFGTLLSGWIVAWKGLWTIAATSGVLFLLLGAAARLAPAPTPERATAGPSPAGIWRDLFGNALFRRVMAVAALVIGSHALNDTFAVIRWRADGLSAGTISVLWSESVISEVVVFLLAGPPLLRRIGPARCAAVAALAGCLRWAVLSLTSAVPALAVIQLTHGLTFALLHLANMQLIGAAVLPERTASAQTLYATIGLSIATAILTAASGFLYGRFGPASFWLSVALCAAALPLTPGLQAGRGEHAAAPAGSPPR